MLAPPGGLALPPGGNPGSATGNNNVRMHGRVKHHCTSLFKVPICDNVLS